MSDDAGAAGPGDVDTLIHHADLDGLVRLIDRLCAGRDWAGLLELRDRSRTAVTTGRQLWPAATLAEYRLALWGPPEWAARVLDEGSGRFTIGPLTEVAAQHHRAAELAPFIDDPIRFGFLAHERALRGEAIDPATTNPLEIPFATAAWEPGYALATYTDEGIDAPSPAPVVVDASVTTSAPADVVDDPDVDSAVRQLFDVWTASSHGHAEVVCVEGTAFGAVAALGVRAARLQPVELATAMAWLAWGGASGAAHGRRRGAASGRFGAWWLLGALTDSLDEWPVDPAELARRAAALRWFWWDAGHPVSGWTVQLAVDDPAEGYAWAITATDATAA